MRPIAVHVESIAYDVSLAHAHKRRVAVVDLELSSTLVDDLMSNLKKRMSDHEPGSIRIRFKGRMVLE